MNTLKPAFVGRYFLNKKDTALDLDRPIKSAILAMHNAYAPYSHFRVGAALITRDGSMFIGCNVEAADYDGTHAEESALSMMVAAGKRAPLYLVVVASLDDKDSILAPAPPCGKCRQKLMEFAQLGNQELRIIVGWTDEQYEYVHLSDLLPDAFGPRRIGIDLSKYGG